LVPRNALALIEFGENFPDGPAIARYLTEYRVIYTEYHMRELLRFLWNSTRGHRFAPWRSPYLRWRMETYSGLKMDKIGFVEFWGFMVRERKQLRRFLKWTAEMDNYARPKPKNP
jgi:hypothetical protein